MSIKAMIFDHPSVGADYNEQLGQAVRHTMYCAAICNSCADACSAEEMDMRQCIRLCMDCADICEATCRVATRRTGGNRALVRNLLATCVHACEICEAECSKHDLAHCRRCADMCRKCAEDCREALVTLNEEAHEMA